MPVPLSAEMGTNSAKSRKASFLSRSVFDVLALLRVDRVHLVHRHHERAARLEDVAADVRVLLGDVLRGVHHQDHDVGALDRLQRLHHGELLDGLEHLALAADARGVDERVGLALPARLDLDRVARGAGLVEGDHALLAQHAVHERRLADVGAPDDGDARVVGLGLAPRGSAGKRRQRVLDRAAARPRRAPRRSRAARRAPARGIPATTMSSCMPSVLLTASSTRRAALAQQLARCACPAARGPARPSTTKMTTSASAIASRAWRAISERMPSFATGSKPPVSTTMKGLSPRRPRP